MRAFVLALLALVAVVPAVATAQNQSFILENRTGSTIVGLNVSPTSSENWGPNILAGTVPDGQMLPVTFPPGVTECVFDVRVAYEDGDTGQVRGVNLCTTFTIVVTYDEDEEETRFQAN